MISFFRAHKRVSVVTFLWVAFCAFWLIPNWREGLLAKDSLAPCSHSGEQFARVLVHAHQRLFSSRKPGFVVVLSGYERPPRKLIALLLPQACMRSRPASSCDGAYDDCVK